MAFKIIGSIINRLKKLPVVRNIPAFDSIPANIQTENLRYYKINNLVQTLGWLVHCTWVLIFFYLKLYPMMLFNICSVMVYIFNIILNRKGHHFLSASLMVIEIMVHQLFAVQLFGWNANFQYYLLVISLFPFLMPPGKWNLKFLLLAVCICSFIYMDFRFGNSEAEWMIGKIWQRYFSISNILFSFTSMCISGGYFVLAIAETEDKLKQKSMELIASEKKATLGALATEMAHEIQNPLNFVNNFSEINAELSKELLEELKKIPLDIDSVNELINQVEKNSDRIHVNGKRVSSIVKSLQDKRNEMEMK